MLDVPYFAQVSESSCGLAAFEMVFKFLRPSRFSKFDQEKAFRRLNEAAPHRAQALRVSSDSIMALALDRNLKAGWGRVSTDPAILLSQLRYFTEELKLPLIACQQWFSDPALGHYRVVIGVEGTNVIFHDPFGDARAARMTIDSFMDCWKTTGFNVTGGVAIWIARRDIAARLDPDQPNTWQDAFGVIPVTGVEIGIEAGVR